MRLLYSLDGKKSLVNSDEFFLGQEKTPYQELLASLGAFERGDGQCRFPARFKFLKKHFPDLSDKECLEYEQWLAQIEGKNVSLVFASQYITNPISSFGHIFLRFSSGWMPSNMDPTFSYAADIAEGTSAFVYAYKGIMGGFQGQFAITPAYYQIHTYNNLENRDLWLYELNLTQEQKSFLLAHLWELLRTSSFDYYFFNENCAGLLLMMLDVLNPQWHLYPKSPLYLPPSEAVKIVYGQGLVKEITYVPSLQGRLESILSQMTKKQKKNFTNSYLHKKVSTDPLVLDALLERLSLHRYKSENKLDSENENYEEKILLARAKSDFSFPRPKVNLDNGPHMAHGLQRLKADFGRRNKGEMNLWYRPAAHGLIDKTAGYLPHAEITVLETGVGFSDDKVFIRDITLIGLSNFTTWPDFGSAWSWSTKLSWGQDLLPFPDRYRANFEASLGAGFDTFSALFYFGLRNNIFIGSSTLGDFTSGPELAVFKNFKKINIWGQVSVTKSWAKDYDLIMQPSLNLRWELTPQWSIFIRAKQWKDISAGRELISEYFIGPGVYF
jgi:hypothetical protein